MNQASSNKGNHSLNLPPVSIIVITLNEEQVLPRLLEQLAHQIFQNFELIISDSNSSDATELIAKKYNHIGTHFHFHNCGVTKGPGYGRNQGVLHAKNEILLFIDADTLLPDDLFLEHILTYYCERNIDIAGCYIKPNTNNMLHIIGCRISNFIFDLFRKRFPIVPGGCMISSKKYHKIVGGFDTTIKLGEDTLYAMQCKDAGAKLGRVPYSFLYDMRRIQKKGPFYMAKIYLKAFRIAELQKKGLGSKEVKTIDYDFDIYKHNTK